MHTINLNGREVAEAGLTRRLKLAEEASIKIDVIDLVDDEEEQATRPHQPTSHRPPEDRRSDDGRDATSPATAPRLLPFHGVLSANDDGEVLFRNGSLSGERRAYSRRPIHASPDSTSSSSERARGRRDDPFQPSPSSTHSKASKGSCIIFNRSYVKTPTSSSTTASGISPTRYNVFDRAPMTGDRSSLLIRNAFQRAGSRPPMLSGSSDTSTSIHGPSPTIDITGHRGSESPLPRVSLLRRSYHKSSGESATSSTSHHPVVATIDLDSDCSPVRSSNHAKTIQSPEEIDDSSSSSECATTSKLPRQPPLARDEKMEVAEDPAAATTAAFVDIDLDSIAARSEENLPNANGENHPTDTQTTEDEPDQQQEDDEGSSMENSYGDVSSSGCVKYSSTRHSMGRQGVTETPGSNSMNEFELKLQEINAWVKPMTHRDRVEHWRVTEEDLRHSIPTKAKIETTSCSGTKRTFYDTVHISSEDDSSDADSPIEGIPSAMGGSMLTTTKKRRTADAMEASTSTSTSQLRTGVLNGLATDRTACAGTSAPTTLSLDDGEDSDFRNGQLNPDIDKPQAGTSMLLIKRAYHKLPSRNRLCKRCNKCTPTEVPYGTGVPVPGDQTYCDCRRAIETPNKGPNGTPYAQLLCRDRGLDSFLHYLRISPLHRTNQLATAPPPPPPPSSGDVAPGSKVEQDAQSVSKSAHGIERRTKSNSRTQRKTNKEKRRVIKSKKKVPAKSKTHPGTIASSAIRGVRRLVLSSSLRSGKVIRYRTTFPSLRQPPRQGKCTPRITAAMANHEAPSVTESKPVPRTDVPGDASEGASLPAQQQQQQLDSLVHSPPMASSSSSSSSSMTRKPKPKSLHRTAAAASLRCSVDSAVSSSTSAEMHEGKRSKECQTEESALAPETVAVVECPPDPPPKPVNEGIPCRNPVSRNDGEVLHVFLLDEKLIVVQTGLVSFWRYSRLSALLGVRQEWERVAQVSRWLRDTELDTENAHRIGYNNCHPFYLEPRARNLTEDESRTCPLASIYVNAYFLITKIHMLTSGAPSGDEGEQDKPETNVDDGTAGPAPENQETVREEDVARVKSYQLDTVKSTLEDVLFLPIPNTRYFIVCWYEHVREMESKTGLCKYSLTPDLETLASIREFPSVRQKLNSLRCLPNSRLLGLGESTVHLWCYETGHLLWTIDLKLSLGTIVGSFVHREMVESTLFLFQLQPVVNESSRKLMKVIAVNLYKKAWYVAHSYEVALSSMRITGESQLADPTQEGNQRHCVTFQSGEMLLVSLNTPSFCWTNHKRLAKDLQHAEECSVLVCSRLRSNTGDVYRPKERIQNAGYWHGGRDLLLLGDQCLTIKSIDEYMAESAR